MTQDSKDLQKRTLTKVFDVTFYEYVLQISDCIRAKNKLYSPLTVVHGSVLG